ncbi:hypothetical protein [Deinococcus altitudinis]|uniref:hypothetical protein n=1 Tax=Deinococcus altitudinis TaxID=468914 RepID=UPI0038911C53
MNWKTPIVTGLMLFGGCRGATFGDLVYTVPPGWKAQTSGDSLTLVPQNLVSGETALITLSKGVAFDGNFSAEFERVTGHAAQGYVVVKRSEVQQSKDETGTPLLARATVLQNPAGQTLYLYYVAAHPPGRIELLIYSASSLEVFEKYQPGLTALSASVTFRPQGGAAGGQAQTPPSGQKSATQPPATQPPTKQPPTKQPPTKQPPTKQAVTAPPTPQITSRPLAVPRMGALVAAGLDPRKQPVPDEFRCYPELESASYQKPVFALQMLGKGQYRVGSETGTYTVKVDSSFNRVQFASGPLKGTDDSTIFWDRKYGQSIKLYRFPLKDDRTLNLLCYQRGAREALAQLEFRRKDPQPGTYACRSSDGKNTDKGALQILANRAYRYAGGGGNYRADILGDQSDDFSSVEFSGGPLEDMNVTYRENDLGERQFSIINRMKCTVVVKPTLPAQFGPDQAPAPPQGAGGLQGAYSKQQQQVMLGGGLEFVRYFYIFSKNGYVFTGDPDTSLADADCRRTFPNGLPVCEVYRLQGGRITIGTDKPVSFERRGTALVLDGDALGPVQPVGNLKLQGEYKSTSTFTAVGGTGGGIFLNFLRFGKDGRFTRESNGGISITTTTTGTSSGDVTGGVSSSSTRKNGGKYAFAGNTLTLSYDDGRVERLFAFLPQVGKDGKPDLKWLYLKGDDYFLQDPAKK